MAQQLENGTYRCEHCGLTSPRGHARPLTWIQKHEANCPKNPELAEESE